MAQNLTRPDEYIPPDDLIGLRQPITPEQFESICRTHRDLRLELTSTGELIIMPPTASQTGRRNSNLTYQLEAWARTNESGVCFGSSAGFTLPNNAIRSPDASWVKRDKWDRLTDKQKESFGPLCPDFVVELRTPTDRLTQLRDKMEEYIANGASLGWLIDPSQRRVYVYRPDQDVVILEDPEIVAGDPLLPGFKLSMVELW